MGDGSAKPVRLFVAVDVPPDVADRLDASVAAVRRSVPGGRWTDRSGWHVTLRFLGWTSPEAVGRVAEAVAVVAGSVGAFPTRLTRLGAFPSPGRARVLWAGLDDPGGTFAQMVKLLDHHLSAFGEPERRRFSPHLTLARVDPPARLTPDVVATEVGSASFVVDRLVLYRSHLSSKGARYEALAAPPLRGARRATVDPANDA